MKKHKSQTCNDYLIGKAGINFTGPTTSHLDQALPTEFLNISPVNAINARVTEPDTSSEQDPGRMPFHVPIQLHVPSAELTIIWRFKVLEMVFTSLTYCQASNL